MRRGNRFALVWLPTFFVAACRGGNNEAETSVTTLQTLSKALCSASSQTDANSRRQNLASSAATATGGSFTETSANQSEDRLVAQLQRISSISADPTALKRYELSVPVVSAGLASHTIRLVKGDSVEMVAHSSTAGMVTVHGLTDEVPVTVDGVATIRFLASHTGRFALHFHGLGDAHTEIAIVEIWPR
jgi:hypothetical protein